MKPITKKVIEAGLIPKHTLLMFKRWGYLDPEDTSLPEGSKAVIATADQLKAGFTQLVEELDTLLEEKAEEGIKETRFSVMLIDPFRIKWLVEDKHGNWTSRHELPIVVFKDEAGNMIFPPSAGDPADRRFEMYNSKIQYEITSSVPLWYGDTLYAYQVEAEPIHTRSDRATL